MKYNLFISDIDGTLVEEASLTFSSETIDIINNIKSLGVDFIPCTGRPISYLPTNLDCVSPKYAILLSGAFIYDFVNKKYLYSLYLDFPSVERIINVEKDLDSYLVCFFSNDTYIDTRNTSICINKNTPNVSKMTIYTKPEHKKEYYNLFTSLFPDLYVSSYNSFSIELTNKNANKAYAIKYLCNYLNITPDKCIYAGDSNNDIPPIKEVGLSIAPKNGDEEVKEIVDIITDSYESCGIVNKVLEICKKDYVI